MGIGVCEWGIGLEVWNGVLLVVKFESMNLYKVLDRQSDL